MAMVFGDRSYILSFLFLIAAALFYRYFLVKRMSERGILITKIVVAAMSVSVLIWTGFVVFKSGGTEGVDSWQAQVMGYDDLHNLSRGENTVIALIDSGISDFQWDMKNVVERANDGDFDANGHGTMMCSLIVGNEDGVAGIAPEATVYSYMIVDESGKVDSEKLYEAINQAVDDRVDIINISLGSFKENEKVRGTIEEALSEGIVVVASAGDYEAEDMLFPANMDGVISVGALDKEGQSWSSNNATDSCTVLAPGVDIPTIDNTGIIWSTSGTSQASAIVTGYVALLKSVADEKGYSFDSEKAIEILEKINSGNSTYVDELTHLSD